MSWVASLLLAAAGAQAGPLALESAIVHEAPEAGVHIGGYIRIRNDGAVPDRLVGIDCTCSRASELHDTRSGEMETLPTLEIPAGGMVEIRPGSGLHIMFEAVGPIPAGADVEVTLRFERAGSVTLPFSVVAETAPAWEPA